MTGQVFGVTEHPNSKDPRRMSYRFAGKFLLIDHNGTVINGHECYFPPKVERALRAALDLNPSGQPVPVAIEVWCEPDQEGKPRSPMEYSYASYDRSIQRENDPLMALAYETGLLERPTTALPAPETDAEETIDPETGEITRRASVAA
jgi:hypothetical protein